MILMEVDHPSGAFQVHVRLWKAAMSINNCFFVCSLDVNFITFGLHSIISVCQYQNQKGLREKSQTLWQGQAMLEN